MRILTIGSPDTPVALWRIIRPMRALAANTDHEIDFQNRLVEALTGNEDKDDFTEIELEQAARHLGSYDIVFLSYYLLSGPAYALLLAVTQRHGTKFIIDFDDNIFAINPDNPIWLTVSHERMHDLQTIARVHPHITTSTRQLAGVMRTRRPEHPAESVSVIQNFISDDYKQYDPKNGDRVVVGYFGGSSHFADLNESGFPKAMRDIMREHSNVEFRAVGVPLDIPMAGSRQSFIDSVRGEAWATDVFPKLQMDIAVGPLLHNNFNFGKSNIKWQEATRAGAAFVASNVGPYADLSDLAAVKVKNTRAAWHDALEYLITNTAHRRTMVERARQNLAANWRLEDHWQLYRDLFAALKTQR